MRLAHAHNRFYRTMPAASSPNERRGGSGDGGLPAPSRQGRLLLVRATLANLR
ncbi:MAG: hypothetical protein LC793_04220 [Thermomicrobia bacterium]|nr:hypothetical protein [Thermomicrobia bacterium]MCA1724714.1 hypothetical protein [Thermomicrobia bacterium]